MNSLKFSFLLLLCSVAEVLGVTNYCTTNPNPCINGGACVDPSTDQTVQSWYICRCLASYSGEHCEISMVVPSDLIGVEVFNCYTNPCLNGGLCVNGIQGGYCQCPSTATGTRCETRIIIDPIQSPGTSAYCTTFGNRCVNGGSCIDRTTSPTLTSWYICSCPIGYTGDHCEVGGGSQNPDVYYTYYCSRIGNPCQNGGLCVDRSSRPSITSWYMCSCISGYSGDHCEIIGGQGNRGVYTDYCRLVANPCGNGGSCTDRTTNPFIASLYTCTCLYGFSGVHCEIRDTQTDGGVNNYCTINPNPCINGGQCVDRTQDSTIVSWYICRCHGGYSGDHCEIGGQGNAVVNYCRLVANPCRNGGSCTDRTTNPFIASLYTCTCLHGFSGVHCEISGTQIDGGVNYCTVNPNPCINGGQCVDRTQDSTIVSWYICRCHGGYSGDHCEIRGVEIDGGVNYCTVNPNPCINGGQCVDKSQDSTVVSWYICRCHGGYSGDHCEIGGQDNAVMNYCRLVANPCINGGSCTDRSTNPFIASLYTCTCLHGFSGVHCEIRSIPNDVGNNYCTVNPNPCINGGQCVDKSQDFTIASWYICRCHGGYSGDHCEIGGQVNVGLYIGYCGRMTNPCRNGGSCTDRTTNPSIASGYTCRCLFGFSGDHCELRGVQIDGGADNYCTVNPNPCINGGQCVDMTQDSYIISGYICRCHGGYSGDHCENGNYIMGRAGAAICEDYNPCRNGGICKYDDGSFSCECPERCNGPLCDDCGEIPDPVGSGFEDYYSSYVCNPNPCKGDCICQPSCRHSNGYICKSTSGFLGKDCTIPVPKLICDTDRITITVSEGFVREYDRQLDNSLILISPDSRVTPSSCVVKMSTNGFYTYTILFPFDTCGTTKNSTSGGEVYTNIMWFNKVLSNTLFDVPVPAARFQCTYRREYNVITSLRPVAPTVETIYDSMTTLPSISLCKSPACPGTCPDHLSVSRGGFYTVGETIYVTMHLDIADLVDRGIVNTIHNMFLSCSENPDQTPDAIYIVQNGCGTSSGLPCDISHTGKGATVCVNFDTPRLPNCNQFFIHAELRSCKSTSLKTCTSVQSSYCTTNSWDRKKRAISNDTTTAEAYTVIGPIFIVTNASEGVPRVDLFPEDVPETLSAVDFSSLGDNETDDNDTPEEPRPVKSRLQVWILILAAVLVVSLLSFAFVVSFVCKSKYEDGDLLVPKSPSV
uniref:Vitelline coat protein VC130 n=1 Tax=Halocynthia aurantium TaxID=254849 RepID=Q3V641_HALAU|nr:vitelline coat protein precursor VC130 [Halocynthia aurantium]